MIVGRRMRAVTGQVMVMAFAGALAWRFGQGEGEGGAREALSQ